MAEEDTEGPEYGEEAEAPDSERRSDVDLEPPFDYEDTDPNLVEVFDKTDEGRKALRELGRYVIETFDYDWEAGSRRREMLAEDIRQFAGDLPPKDFPWEGCANANVPIMMTNLGLLHSRLMGEIFGDWVNVVGVSPIGSDDEEIADAVSRHSNWQMRSSVPDFKRQSDRAMMAFLFAGDVTWYSYWDQERRVNRHVVLTPDEFVKPASHVSTLPDYSDLPHYTWVRQMHRHELEAHLDLWSNVDRIISLGPDDSEEDPDSPTLEAVRDVQGLDFDGVSGSMANFDEKDAFGRVIPIGVNSTFKVLHHYGWMRLPGQDRDRWCQAIVHYETSRVLLLRIYEEEDWRDRRRFDVERAEWEQYRTAYLQHQQQVTSAMAFGEAIANQDTLLPEDAAAVEQTLAQVPDAPTAPQWMEHPDAKPEPVQSYPIYDFAHAVCIENLVGADGLGMGRVEGDFQRAASTLLCQGIDAATLGNAWTILHHKSLDFGKTKPKIRPGAMIPVTGVAPGEIADSLIELKPPGANPQVFDALKMIREFAEEAVQAAEVLGGAPGKSGETAQGLSSRLEQATKQLGIYAMRFAIGLQQVYRNNARLNAIYMPESELVIINDDRVPRPGFEIRREWYERGYRFEILSNLRFSSEAQRIGESDQMMSLVMNHEILKQNFAIQYAVIKEAFEARGKHHLVKLLGAPPPAPETFVPPPPPMPPGGGMPGGTPGAEGPPPGEPPPLRVA